MAAAQGLVDETRADIAGGADNCNFHGLLRGAFLLVRRIGFTRGADKMDNPFITVL
jgi:hypothetical protein